MERYNSYKDSEMEWIEKFPSVIGIQKFKWGYFLENKVFGEKKFSDLLKIVPDM